MHSRLAFKVAVLGVGPVLLPWMLRLQTVGGECCCLEPSAAAVAAAAGGAGTTAAAAAGCMPS